MRREEPAISGADVLIANEFAEVRVRRVSTHNGVRLEISSPRLGHAIRLDPLQLECLTWQEPDVFSGLLIDPFGPGPVETGPVETGPADSGGHR